MGGGTAAIRAAAKVAGFGVYNIGLRGIPGVSPAEHPFKSAARVAVTRAGISSSSITNNTDVAETVQKPYLEMNDWKFAGGEGEEPFSRLIFGGAPTLEEAAEATAELKIALDNAYLSPKSTDGSFISSHEPDMLVLSNSEHLESKATVPKNAIRAFNFLSESATAQRVVASIATDPNVLNAVMQNEALMEFLQSQKKGTSSFSDIDGSVKSDACSEFSSVRSSSQEYGTRNSYSYSFQNLKLTVTEMMNTLSGYFRYLFGDIEVVEGGQTPLADKAVSASFMGLAVMVIVVVVLKRD